MSIKGVEVVEKDVLFFKFDKAGFDGVATKEHIKAHPGIFQEFLNTHPDFVLPKSFSEVEIGSPVLSARVVEPKVVVAPKKAKEDK